MTDQLQRFMFEGQPVRGEFVQLEATWRTVLERRQYPAAVRRVLGEALAATALLAASIKLHGQLTLQIEAQGPLQLLVVQATAQRTLRALARYQEPFPLDDQPGLTLSQLCGQGRLQLTIDQGRGGEPYKGVVSLEEGSLVQALEAYFARSEQLPTKLYLAANGERASGLLLQQLPDEQDGDDSDLWNRVEQLANTLTEMELLELDSGHLLYRLFHEEDIRVLDADDWSFRCTCSQERTQGMLRTLEPEELRQLLLEQGGTVQVNCEFCGLAYRFDVVDIEALLADAGTPGTTRH